MVVHGYHLTHSMPHAEVHSGTNNICRYVFIFQVGVGRFQWLMLLICGLANAADATEIMSVGLVIPSAENDPQLGLTPAGRAAMSSCIFAGMLVGGLAAGFLSDSIGTPA